MSRAARQPSFVPQGQDRFGEHHNMGAGVLAFKVTAAESHGALVIVELAHHTPGGPPRHRHPQQDEWFYVVAGRYVVAVGDQQFELGPGDAALGPRAVPHTWAYRGGDPGRIVLVVSPAGQIEDFLRALSRLHAFAPPDPAFWQRYGLELVGPPLPV
jgi:mannose-6-phosphate isomerase-like protein (cupin superfamily)